MIIRARVERAGGHTHVAVFATMYAESSLGKAGDLCFRNEEWDVIAPALSRVGWQIVAAPSGEDHAT